MSIAGSAVAATSGDGSRPAPTQVARLVTDVPVTTLDRVGAGQVLGQSGFPVTKLHGALLKLAGKPELLTTIFSWCPHCAANSWSLAVALSRFGTLSGLRIIDTGTLYPQFHHTAGLSFLSARLKSPYVAFVPVILQDVNGHNLESETPAEKQAIQPFDPSGTPAIDVGGRWGFTSSGYSPAVLSGKTWSEIAARLAHGKTPVAKSVDGLANLFTAAICQGTGGRPVSVCRSHGVLAAKHRLR
jgi:hypothetical protein